ncbi:CAP domain-containing protein [Crepidotus variabilis]|uniref:CAP domain-containing protein n=1 Tax=Crepidotus variabilis TaxID=179855 RepID=A0A9P6JN85_9AGAR|nr:CAP domain-containing protein [Crepidotus variabilis]
MKLLVALATLAIGFSYVPGGAAQSFGGHGRKASWSSKHRSKWTCDEPITSESLAPAVTSNALERAHGPHTVTVIVNEYTTTTVPPPKPTPTHSTVVNAVIASSHGPHIVTVVVTDYTTTTIHPHKSATVGPVVSSTSIPRQDVSPTATKSTPNTKQTKVSASTAVASSKTTPPAAKATPASNGTCNGSPDDIQLYLDSHNSYRRLHGANDLAWNASLASNAQAWTDRCYYGHSSAGENIANAVPLSIPYIVKEAWGKNEAKYFHKGMAFDSNTFEKYGHYTQLVWKGSQQLGCGCTVCNGTMSFVSCKYYPPGNWLGEFDANVDEAQE